MRRNGSRWCGQGGGWWSVEEPNPRSNPTHPNPGRDGRHVQEKAPMGMYVLHLTHPAVHGMQTVDMLLSFARLAGTPHSVRTGFKR